MQQLRPKLITQFIIGKETMNIADIGTIKPTPKQTLSRASVNSAVLSTSEVAFFVRIILVTIMHIDVSRM